MVDIITTPREIVVEWKNERFVFRGRPLYSGEMRLLAPYNEMSQPGQTETESLQKVLDLQKTAKDIIEAGGCATLESSSVTVNGEPLKMADFLSLSMFAVPVMFLIGELIGISTLGEEDEKNLEGPRPNGMPDGELESGPVENLT